MIKIKRIQGNDYKQFTYMEHFTDNIYKNFIELADYPYLKHTKKEITRLLTSPNLVLYLIIYNHNIIGYALCEIIKLQDQRTVIFISYIYINQTYRHKKIGSSVMYDIKNYAMQLNLDGVALICNTDDDRIINFYYQKGYMPDMILRRYNKYDVLSISV